MLPTFQFFGDALIVAVSFEPSMNCFHLFAVLLLLPHGFPQHIGIACGEIGKFLRQQHDLFLVNLSLGSHVCGVLHYSSISRSYLWVRAVASVR